MSRVITRVAFALLGLAVACTATGDATRFTQADAQGRRLDEFIRAELDEKGIPAFALALVRGDEVVWQQCFGVAGTEPAVPADSSTQWRAGSVSKMFTDLAVMQLVEEGRLALDAPVTDWLPDFQPKNPFATPITLRQLMAHRAGLVREPPIGHYFDATSPTLAATVASLNGTTLVYAPGTKTKYSNAGIAVVGRVLEVVLQRPFADLVRDRVLLPMGLTQSAFTPTPCIAAELAHASMWTYWGTTFPAATFELGMAPAGSLYAPIGDLAQAARVFLADGIGPDGRPIVTAASLAEMWKPQFAEAGAKSGFGLGFHVGEFAGRRSVGHDGAIYGFSTVLQLLPDENLGVVAVAAMDVVHGTVQKIVHAALEALLAEQAGTDWTLPAPTRPMDPRLARAAAGSYATADGKTQVELFEQQGKLWLAEGASRSRLRATSANDFLIDDRITFNGKRRVALPDPGTTLKLGETSYSRVASARPPPPAAEMAGLLGEYGFDHNVLFVFEKEGRLHALIEWFFDYPLTRASTDPSGDVWDFPEQGLYFGEKVVFRRDASGRATEAIAAGIVFPRRQVGTPEGVTFQIPPVRPVSELRAAALAASPPREEGLRQPDLVELVTVDPSLHLDIRYATTNNFMGTTFYDEPRAFLQRPAAEALARAHARLKEQGLGLLIHDGYRPWFVTRMFWDGTPAEHHHMVADPAKGSRHNRGCAVDLTLCDPATGQALRMPSGYDEFSDRANPWYFGGTSEQRWLRDTLRHAMEREGFTVYEHEWWHYDFGAWREYPVLNLRFEEVARQP